MRSLNVSLNNSAYIHRDRSVLLPNKATSKEIAVEPQKDNLSYIRLEIKIKTLSNLLARNALVVEDLRCLDRKTKNYLKQLLLDNLMACGPP